MFLIDGLLEVKLQTAADQVLPNIGVGEFIPRVGVIEELVLGEHAPFWREIVISTCSHLESEAAVVPRPKTLSRVSDGDVNVSASFAPPTADPAKNVGLKTASSIRCKTKDNVRHERSCIEHG